MVVAVLGLCALNASSASAFELLSWWRRDLIDVRLVPGDWARYAALEISEEGALADTLTVTVLDGDGPQTRWLRVEGGPDEPVDFLLVAPDRLRGSDQPLDAILRLVRREIDGSFTEEDLDAQRESRLVQRHLDDPFENPTVEREDLADTTVAGRTLGRERVVLSEKRVQEREVGRSRLIIETDLRSVAQLSAALPLIGVIEARTVTMVSTRTESADRPSRRAAPPLLSEQSLRCLDFGRLDPVPRVVIPERPGRP